MYLLCNQKPILQYVITLHSVAWYNIGGGIEICLLICILAPTVIVNVNCVPESTSTQPGHPRQDGVATSSNLLFASETIHIDDIRRQHHENCNERGFKVNNIKIVNDPLSNASSHLSLVEFVDSF